MMSFGRNMPTPSTKLFVGGLNYNTTDDQLGQFFSKFGTVQECVIMKFPDSGESRGFGFVTFSNEQEVAWCLSSLPLTLDGKNVDVKRAEAPTRDGTKVGGGIRDGVKRKGGDANCKVFVGGLNYSTQDDMLKQVFSRYGKVNDWVIMKFPDSGESRGFGFVTFSSPEEVERCLINQPIIVDGKSVDIKKAEPPSARGPQNSKPLNNKRYKQKEKESSIENKMPRGGGTMADICSGGNQCGGGFGNNCGHDTFSTIASQVVAMTTNSHKQEPVQEDTQDYSAYYVEYAKWYASWKQYNDYIQGMSSGATRQAPPLPPGERPKTPPQDQSAATKQPAVKENPASIKAPPQYNQEYFVGRQYSQQYWAGQQAGSQYNPADPYNSVKHHNSADPYNSVKHHNPADPYNSVNQYNTADQYNQQVSSQYQGAQGGTSTQREGSNQRHGQDQPRKRKSDSSQSGYNNGATGYNVDRPGYNDDGNRSNDENEFSNYRNRYDNYANRSNNDGNDESRYDSGPRVNNDGTSHNHDGPGFNNERPQFNNEGPWPRNQNNGGGGSNFGNDQGAAGGVEPERNEFYYHNLETLKRKKMRMSS